MKKRKTLVIGGAGFIGCNTVGYFCELGDEVIVVDNLSRLGTQNNLEWLQEKYDIQFYRGDIRNLPDMERVFIDHPDIGVVIHLAAQTAVTFSVANPREDFEINALGTFNVMEAVRKMEVPPVVLYASTNKVYGSLDEVAVVEEEKRYSFRDFPKGISEGHPLDFHSPYGCSKGAADQYVRDYARIYGIRTIVFRQSCIYGYRQFGIEDQGWVAWFLAAVLSGKEIMVYGDGKQVRDVLFIDDLTRAYAEALDRIEVTAGKVYNIGGGEQRSLSVWVEFNSLLSDLTGKSIHMRSGDWRPGDQKIFIADIDKAKREFYWEPHIGVEEGVAQLCGWIEDNLDLFRQLGITEKRSE
jgi:CDP-paratose 2-epimerase